MIHINYTIHLDHLTSAVCPSESYLEACARTTGYFKLQTCIRMVDSGQLLCYLVKYSFFHFPHRNSNRISFSFIDHSPGVRTRLEVDHLPIQCCFLDPSFNPSNWHQILINFSPFPPAALELRSRVNKSFNHTHTFLHQNSTANDISRIVISSIKRDHKSYIVRISSRTPFRRIHQLPFSMGRLVRISSQSHSGLTQG